MPAKIDMIGKKFNRLTVLSESVADSHGQITYTCRCERGNIVEGIRGRDLRSGNTKSCGCLNKEKYVERINKNTVNHSNISYIKSKKLSVRNTTGVRGVCPTKRGLYRATIGHKGKQIYLGEFSKLEDAVKARKDAEKIYFDSVLCENNLT